MSSRELRAIELLKLSQKENERLSEQLHFANARLRMFDDVMLIVKSETFRQGYGETGPNVYSKINDFIQDSEVWQKSEDSLQKAFRENDKEAPCKAEKETDKGSYGVGNTEDRFCS